jgi:hypothetical protein
MRKPAGNTPGRHGRHDAVQVRGADADADEREHVGALVHERLPHALEKRPAAPEDHGRRKREADPVHDGGTDAMADGSARQHVAHGHDEHRRAERDADPEAPRHVDELGVRRVGQIRDTWLERHPAFRARAGAVADDLGMHRTDPFRPRFRPPIETKGGAGAPIGSRAPDRYFPGFAENFAAHPFEQK